MNMSRAEGVTIHQLKELASRTIIGNRVGSRAQAIEPVPTLLIRLKLATQVELYLLRILLLIQSFRGSLPYLDRGTDKRLLSLEVHHATLHEHHLGISRLRLDDILAVLAPGCIGTEEGTQDSRGSGRILSFFGELEGDFVDETVTQRRGILGIPLSSSLCVIAGEIMGLRFKSEHIAHQLSLIALIVAHLSGPVEHLYAGHPLVNGELLLARIVVHVADQAGHELSHAGRGLGAHRLDDPVSEGGVEAVRRHVCA